MPENPGGAGRAKRSQEEPRRKAGQKRRRSQEARSIKMSREDEEEECSALWMERQSHNKQYVSFANVFEFVDILAWLLK